MQVLKIVLLSHFLVVSCHDVLLLLVPLEFFPLIFADFLNSVAFVHEALVGLRGYLHRVVYVLWALCLGVVVDLERPV